MFESASGKTRYFYGPRWQTKSVREKLTDRNVVFSLPVSSPILISSNLLLTSPQFVHTSLPSGGCSSLFSLYDHTDSARWLGFRTDSSLLRGRTSLSRLRQSVRAIFLQRRVRVLLFPIDTRSGYAVGANLPIIGSVHRNILRFTRSVPPLWACAQ